jgi:hypothetical protein
MKEEKKMNNALETEKINHLLLCKAKKFKNEVEIYALYNRDFFIKFLSLYCMHRRDWVVSF